MNTDILRIMHEMQTFTCQEIAEALEMTPQGTMRHIEKYLRLRYLERIRIGYTFVYATTLKTGLLVSKLPALDDTEMCLPLSFDFE